MTDRPILFSGPMVRALLEGHKTQTRRLAWRLTTRGGRYCEAPTLWQKVETGDRLWVRETWGCPAADHPKVPDGRKPVESDRIVYRANLADDYQWSRPGHPGIADFVWRPSIHMPRWASRLTLEVTDVRLERLQALSWTDALAEGVVSPTVDSTPPIQYEVPGFDFFADSPENAQAMLWEALHGEGSWKVNPEIVALTFTVELGNIDCVPLSLVTTQGTDNG